VRTHSCTTPHSLLHHFLMHHSLMHHSLLARLHQFGPTTVERASNCFNMTQDTGECNWAGPSWPYETSRVLSGLSRFLIDYPPAQSSGAGMTSTHYTKLLRTYAQSMTMGSATNGSECIGTVHY
jgi:hypothetical protein